MNDCRRSNPGSRGCSEPWLQRVRMLHILEDQSPKKANKKERKEEEAKRKATEALPKDSMGLEVLLNR